jgi:hypothetical protein
MLGDRKSNRSDRSSQQGSRNHSGSHRRRRGWRRVAERLMRKISTEVKGFIGFVGRGMRQWVRVMGIE